MEEEKGRGMTEDDLRKGIHAGEGEKQLGGRCDRGRPMKKRQKKKKKKKKKKGKEEKVCENEHVRRERGLGLATDPYSLGGNTYSEGQ